MLSQLINYRRTLQPDEKKSYIDAVLCLQGLPAALSSTIPGAVSRFNNFIEKVHLNGQFLPWHRYFTAVFEDSLRIHCGYAGGQPYWDWTLDIKPGQAFANSPVFSLTDGFGGNGPYIPCAEQPYNLFCLANGTGGGCVSDSPFKNAVLHLGPGRNIESNNHCLTRNFHPQFPARWLSEAEVNRTMAEGSYGRFWRHLEGMFEVERMGLHGAGHLGIGDLLFYLHHANLDRLWWKWQEQNPQPRLKEVSGPVSQKQGAGNIAGKVNIADVMHIKQKALCYDYS
ncbi:hypothetical protein B9Z19DRAFT_1101943 [Tuber borchii]|uniref:Tyrosinase copper-binding domain-containing protein n=1 Tax=Tuber borchii TaxID=42251 RepID=A0A2T6ZP82_TUBBO|nr:hypothetical protein B9Z19DRAFT_1101943 [Tuber borchii]